MPTVLINTHSSLESLYDGIREMLNARYHQPGNSFPSYKISDQELTEISSLSSYACHASDNLYVDGIHIERLIT
jgi:hypothetical protein